MDDSRKKTTARKIILKIEECEECPHVDGVRWWCTKINEDICDRPQSQPVHKDCPLEEWK
jgi:hypothetical protein